MAIEFVKRSIKPSDFGKLKHINPPGWNYTVNIDLDKTVYKKIKDDGILLEEMHQAEESFFQKHVIETLGRTLSVFDKYINDAIEHGEPQKNIQKMIDGLNKTIQDNIAVAQSAGTSVITKVYDDFAKRSKEYTKYKIKVFTKITGGVASLITSITVFATTPFSFGASSVIAMVGIAKTLVTLSNDIKSAALTVEQSLKEFKIKLSYLKKVTGDNLLKQRALEELLRHPGIQRQLETLGLEACVDKIMGNPFLGKLCSRKTLAKALSSGKVGSTGLSGTAVANEVTANLLTQFFGISQPSIKGCEAHWDVIGNKLTGIEITSHKYSKKINSSLDAQEKYTAEFMAEVDKRLKKYTGADKAAQRKKIEDKLCAQAEKQQAKIINLIDDTMAAYQRFKKAKDKIDALTPNVEALIALRATMGFKVFDQILSVADIALGTVDAVSGDFSSVAKITETIASSYGQAVAEFAIDKVSSVILDGTILA